MRNLNDAVGVDIGFVRNQSHVLNARAFEIEYPDVNGGVKTGHAAEQKSATMGRA